ncbi:hypothetical protein [Tessaracoccus sp.]|uniref:hypothetical protein n=1 Tax=Tessaracoccus sp. TaxID=1971211 RepID=UPI002614AA93|nr:hypothetical protein [Tessaracoccus sp.]
MRERPIAATGVLAAFCDANLLSLVDFHLARRVGDLAGEANPTVHLAFALAVRELRLGSVCVDLATAAAELRPELDGEDDVDVAALAWPEPSAWLAAVAASPAVAGPDGEGVPSGWTDRCCISTGTGGAGASACPPASRPQRRGAR